jgi:hypothetical protein
MIFGQEGSKLNSLISVGSALLAKIKASQPIVRKSDTGLITY